ncbi:enoyl-[acyl-carrier-protein] reductase [Acidithiobacillus thiooxidans]|uniref:Enoyl-[acyl-carrier-protein] reductase [NADH] n=1 Tax=Acidithiobacillus thiooxidans TaxID=930 RepID=A0A1C2IY62_ACITH|nr:enoyl-ACP reductase [Acidithiobacillus thiooxidans]OCX69531.1 enoyl-[acyl-carrier-protein] reductase [Acidithiobacillus thiooxidans]OCX69593.1 enoyl-[acyl-carrier-protein] reductase [Acidithiobacillus thiooxidans]OCX73055.1 enoyl-[acyl-carrier-protein] reductase [Acidithiobacillus thiooxidans]OCX80953.1 enoyl-[acyl-carrier-protein] reductase [Acidithiobacillus thiooxidans]OCX85378.1 enoyl-[acyl-carrier-protein] reductase [Acidithiobacillus thiooxidans]
MGFMTGKKALIVGVANDRSICWGIAQAMHRQGAEVLLTYQGERTKSRVEELAGQIGAPEPLELDLMDEQQLLAAMERVQSLWGGVDIGIHGAAFAPKEELSGSYLDATTREGFRIAHEVSSYSFTAMAKAMHPLMQGRQGALLALSYLGAERAMANYNVMGLAKASLEASIRYLAYSLGSDGIRVNAISAGPIRTLAASGISEFRKILDHYAEHAPLHRNVTQEEVGNTAAFLCSDLASGITGEITYVDAGFNTVGF